MEEKYAQDLMDLNALDEQSPFERLDDIEARTTELEDALIEVAALLPD